MARRRGSQLERHLGQYIKFGKELFVFCVVWMLRDLELAGVTTEDLTLDHTCRRVTLTLMNLSKMDTEGKVTFEGKEGKIAKTEKLDDGWPESVEEQGLLLLVWTHHITKQYIKDVL